MDTQKKPRPSTMRQLAPYGGSGLQMVMAMGLFGGIGYLLDGRLHTQPWLLVVGLLLGAAGGMISIIRMGSKNK